MIFRNDSLSVENEARFQGFASILFLVSICATFFSRNVISMHLEVRALYVYAVALVLTALAVGMRRSISQPHLMVGFVAAPLIGGAIAGAYWESQTIASLPIWFAMAAIIVFAAPAKVIGWAVEICSIILCVMLVGAIIGYIWASAGGEPLFWWPTERGGHNFQPFSFSSAWVLTETRMNGIYNEPAVLSFFLCLTAASRHVLGLDRRMTAFLLIGGMITVSLAHLIYIFCHIVATFRWPRSSREWRATGGFVAALLIMAAVVSQTSDMTGTFADRLGPPTEDQEAGRLVAGDNRGPRIVAGLEALQNNPVGWLVGVGPNCAVDSNNCEGASYAVGETPLSPIVKWGLVASLHFYLILGVLCLAGLRDRHLFVAVGVALMIAQRPRIVDASYPIAMCVFLYCLLIHFKAHGAKADYRSWWRL